jgi:hypothetical protein
MIALLALSAAHAASSGGVTVLTGVGASFDGNPATVNLEVQGEVPLHTTRVASISLALPVGMTSSAYNGFGVSTDHAMFTFVPALRLRVLNLSPVRLYGDAGAGVAELTGDGDGWMFGETPKRTGFTTQTGLGVEVGPPDGGLALVVEPVGIDTYRFGDVGLVGYTSRIGLGIRY